MSGEENATTRATASAERSSPTSKTSAQSLLARGLRSVRRGRADLAQRAFERAVEAGDTSVAAQAVWQLGKLAYERADLDRAHEYFQRAVDGRDDDVMPRGYNGLGAVFADRRDTAEAQLNFLRAIETGHPEAAPRAAWNLGLLFLGSGDLPAAEAAFALSVESGHVEMAPRAAVQLGSVRTQLGDAQGAASALEIALQAQDSDVAADAALNLGLLRLAEGDTAGAEQAWELALRSSNPQHVEKARDYLASLDEAKVEKHPSTATEATSTSEAEPRPATAQTEAAGLVAPRQRPTFLTALDEAIVLSEDDTDGIAVILQQFRMEDVFGLGYPAGDISPDGGHGTASDLLHFTIDDEAKGSRVLLPVFTQASIMRRALIRNPDWQNLSVLQVNGGALFDNVDNDVIVIINPWSRLEFELTRKSAQANDM
jgi:tetratricopeptide (TPR) repeat protein